MPSWLTFADHHISRFTYQACFNVASVFIPSVPVQCMIDNLLMAGIGVSRAIMLTIP
jgi:hypothetical protein